MKFCIGIMFQREAPWLALHLPVALASGAVDGVVAVDGGPRAPGDPDDGSADVIRRLCDAAGVACDIVDRPFDWRFDQQINTAVRRAEELGYDAMLRLDPDEAMFPAHVAQTKDLLGQYKIIRYPRFNFTRDRRHYCPQFYPDPQGRAFRLHMGLYYLGAYGVHETLWSTATVLGLEERPEDPLDTDILTAHHMHLYHYAGLNSLKERAFRNYVYDRILRGDRIDNDPYVTSRTLPPSWEVTGYPAHIPFSGPQPVDPDVVGDRAPVGPDESADAGERTVPNDILRAK